MRECTVELCWRPLGVDLRSINCINHWEIKKKENEDNPPGAGLQGPSVSKQQPSTNYKYTNIVKIINNNNN